MSKHGRGVHFQPREGILKSLGVTKEQFDLEVFRAYSNDPRRDCHASPYDLPVVFNGRGYRLVEVAHVQIDEFS